MKRCYQVKVIGRNPFTMLVMDGDETPEHVCRCIWGDNLEWVK